MLYCEIQRDLPAGDRLNQHCVNSLGKGLNATDVHLYVKVPHSSFNIKKRYNLGNQCMPSDFTWSLNHDCNMKQQNYPFSWI